MINADKIKYKWVYYIIVFCIIFFSDSTLLFGTIDNKNMRLIGNCIIASFSLLLFVLYLVKYKKFTLDVIVPLALIMFFLIDMVFFNDLKGGYLVKAALIFLSYFLIKLTTFNDTIKIVRNLIFILSIISLATFLIGCINVKSFQFLPQVQNIGNEKFYCGGLFNIICKENLRYMRNYSIFREPGILGFYVIISFLFELLLEESPNKLKLLIFALTMLTTLSVTIFIVFGLIVILFVFVGKEKIGGKWYIGSLIFLILSVITIIPLIIKSELFGSINFQEKFISMQTRISSIYINFKVWLDNPIIGTGIGRYNEEYMNNVGNLKTDGGISSTIAINFAMHGFLFGALTIVSIVCLSLKTNSKIVARIFVCIILFFILFSQNFIYDFLYYFLSVYGLLLFFDKIKLKLIKEKGNENENTLAM